MSAGAVYRYFSSKEDIVEAIAESRHAKEAELINEAMRAADLRSGLHQLADLYFVWLTDPQEQMRRRIGVQVWAEAVNQKGIREIVLRGADQRLLLVEHLRRAQVEGRFKDDLDPEALTRCVPVTVPGVHSAAVPRPRRRRRALPASSAFDHRFDNARSGYHGVVTKPQIL